MPKRLPKLCHYKPTGQAYVRTDGKAKYLGAWDSDDARRRYDDEIARLKRDDEQGRFSIRVGDLALLYEKHAAEYYVRDGEPTSEQKNITIALRRW